MWCTRIKNDWSLVKREAVTLKNEEKNMIFNHYHIIDTCEAGLEFL